MKWDMESVAKVRAIPWEKNGRTETGVICPEQLEGAQVRGDVAVRQERKLYIKKSDIEMFGDSEGCARCEHDLRFGYGRTTKGHSDKCRERIYTELAKTPAGQVRIASAL